MKFENYIEFSRDITLLSDCENVPAVHAMLYAATARRDELRAKIEAKPCLSPDDLQDDLVFMLGEIKGLNWILGLPERSREFLDKIK